MIKFLPLLLLGSTLVACSSGSDDNGNDGTTGGSTSGTTDGNTSGSVDGGQSGGRDGAYIGSVTSGQGLYLVDGANNISGLAINSDGSAVSTFGSVGDGASFGGSWNQYNHSAPVGSVSFGAGDADVMSLDVDVTVMDGESIAGGGVSLTYATGAEAQAATVANLAGTWSGENISESGTLVTTITFSGASLSGETSYTAPGSSQAFTIPITGSIAEVGMAASLSFEWQEKQYDGLVYFALDGSNNLVFVGETDAAETDNPTIGALLSQQ